MLQKWTEARDAALQRDHRIIGQAQGLFMTHTSSPGAIFFLPHGVRIIQKLQEFLRREYRKQKYDEVMTPLVYDQTLWECSGHWQHYANDMFLVSDKNTGVSDKNTELEGTPPHPPLQRALKPMNCPGHCLIFGHTPVSYRDLPMRLADFSPLHRNEASGALAGLTRVRQFHQDDAHIFCTEAQIEAEIHACLHFVDTVYKAFGFNHSMVLSTRPPSYVILLPPPPVF